MKKAIYMLIIVLFVFAGTFLAMNLTKAESDFVYPIEPYTVFQNGQQFGAKRGTNIYHLGDDVIAPAGTEIYSIGDGIVKHIGVHSRYGGVVIVEHTLHTGAKITSLYGHLRIQDVKVTKGQKIAKGDIVGFLGTREENGNWVAHLHFGIHKTPYQEKWVYWGMGSEDKLDQWYDPTEFLTSQGAIANTVTGEIKDYSDGKIITGPGFGGSTHVRVIHKEGFPFSDLGFIAKSGQSSGVDVALADLEHDHNEEIVVGAGPGSEPYVKIFDKYTQNEKLSFLAYHPSFKGGVRVSVGDINGDGYQEIVTAAGPGGGVHVRVFDMKGNVIHSALSPFPKEYRTGADVAVGDVTGDGVDEIIVSNGPGESAQIKILNGKGEIQPTTILAFPEAFKGGSHIAVADIDEDGVGEIIAGAGPGGGPQIRVFEGTGEARGIQFFPFHPTFRGGIDVAAIDFDNDGKDEILTSQFSKGQAWTKVYRYNNAHTIHAEFIAYNKSFEGGANVSGMSALNHKH